MDKLINFFFNNKKHVVNVKYKCKYELIEICDNPDYIIIKNSKGKHVKVFSRAYRMTNFFGIKRAILHGTYKKNKETGLVV